MSVVWRLGLYGLPVFDPQAIRSGLSLNLTDRAGIEENSDCGVEIRHPSSRGSYT
ncbi:hypothetical protein C8035_v011228 [Colletotrichum spinosum]|uniref:Uncharacterized protein n=1 Tax=Colletotrichum spinosum TaxID=1347390 RepID=A0A4R8PUF3_9PEZI|nr:hypothetical protein C8035_v011228 [Colletotrichum spinosum]